MVAVLSAVLWVLAIARGAIRAERQRVRRCAAASTAVGMATAVVVAAEKLRPRVGRIAPLAIPLRAAVRVAHAQEADDAALLGHRLAHV